MSVQRNEFVKHEMATDAVRIGQQAYNAGDAAANRQEYLKVDGLWKAFGEFYALKDINLEIREGEFICFLGPSGCGKTTLLRAIAGLDLQTRGRFIRLPKIFPACRLPNAITGLSFSPMLCFPI